MLEGIASVLRWTAEVIAAVFVAWLFGDVLLLLFAAPLFALGLRGLADLLSRETGIKTGVAALFVVVQTLKGNVLSPMVQRRAVDLPPAATILTQTALGALFGLPGIILATPVAAAILVALREVTSDAA